LGSHPWHTKYSPSNARGARGVTHSCDQPEHAFTCISTPYLGHRSRTSPKLSRQPDQHRHCTPVCVNVLPASRALSAQSESSSLPAVSTVRRQTHERTSTQRGIASRLETYTVSNEPSQAPAIALALLAAGVARTSDTPSRAHEWKFCPNPRRTFSARELLIRSLRTSTAHLWKHPERAKTGASAYLGSNRPSRLPLIHASRRRGVNEVSKPTHEMPERHQSELCWLRAGQSSVPSAPHPAQPSQIRS
jgi:hypothetical protein